MKRDNCCNPQHMPTGMDVVTFLECSQAAAKTIVLGYLGSLVIILKWMYRGGSKCSYNVGVINN